MQTLKIKVVTLLILMVAAMGSSAIAIGDLGYGQVRGEAAALRTGPSARAAEAGRPSDGAYVQLLGKVGRWYFTRSPDQLTGWLNAQNVDSKNEIRSFYGVIRTEQEGALFDVLPDGTGDPLGLIPNGAHVKLLGGRDGRYRVRFGKLEGYVDQGSVFPADGAEPDADALSPKALLPVKPVRKIDPERPMIALTFDDGPSPVTLDVLDVLGEHGAVGTFFMVGNRVGRHAAIVGKVAEQGSEIGMHTWNHRELHRLSAPQIRDSLQKNSNAIEAISGVRPRLLRPPYGTVTGAVRSVCKEMDIVIANWDVDTEDWRNHNTQKIIENILTNASDGSIILTHDLYAQTVEAMKTVVPELLNRGYQLVTVSELLEHRAGGGMAGSVYRSGRQPTRTQGSN